MTYQRTDADTARDAVATIASLRAEVEALTHDISQYAERDTERLAEVKALRIEAAKWQEAVVHHLVVAGIYQEAVVHNLVIAGIYQNEHDADPLKALYEWACWERSVALDPAVSIDARMIIERAEKAEAENAKLREALTEAVGMLDWIGCSPEGYNELMREVEQKRRKFLAALAAQEGER